MKKVPLAHDAGKLLMNWTIRYFAVAFLLTSMGAPAYTHAGDESMNDGRKHLIDFDDTDRGNWYVINDGVMGGLSKSDIRHTDRGTAVFSGVLSLENNGGFASVRFAVEPQDLSMYSGLEIHVRGDGRTYQFRLRTDDRLDGIAYRTHFETLDSDWTTVRLPFNQFRPTFRGRTLSDVPPLDTSQIQQLGFMLADKRPGPFSLEIDFVRTWDSDSIDP